MPTNVQVVRGLRHAPKDAEKNISSEGIVLTKKYAPVILGGFPGKFPTYVGPLIRCTQTARDGLGIRNVIVEEDLFGLPPWATDVIAVNMTEIESRAKAESCTNVAALLKMRSSAKISEMLSHLRERMLEGVKSVCERNPEDSHILVVGHSPTIDASVDDCATSGLNMLDWVDFYVQKGEIIHTVVCKHVAIS